VTPEQILAEQQRLAARCQEHTAMVLWMVTNDDVDGAMAYLNAVKEWDGPQMVTNVTDLMVLTTPGLLPPDML
jgi:hypothetical protein